MPIQDGGTSASSSEDDVIQWTDSSPTGVSLIDSADKLVISPSLSEDDQMTMTSQYQHQQHQLITVVDEEDEEEDLEQRAPFIPMGDEDDLPILDPTEILIEMDQFELASNHYPL